MNVREYWTVLREDKWLVGSVLVVCVAIAAAVALFLPRTYTSTAIFYVASPQTTTSSSDSYQGAQLSTERVKSYSELLHRAPRRRGRLGAARRHARPRGADPELGERGLGRRDRRAQPRRHPPTPQDAQLVGTAVATVVHAPGQQHRVDGPAGEPPDRLDRGDLPADAADLPRRTGYDDAAGRRAARRPRAGSWAPRSAAAHCAAPSTPPRRWRPPSRRRSSPPSRVCRAAPTGPRCSLEPAPGRRGRRAARARDRAAAVRRLRTAVLAGIRRPPLPRHLRGPGRAGHDDGRGRPRRRARPGR